MLRLISGQVTFAALIEEFDMRDLAQMLWIQGFERFELRGSHPDNELAQINAFSDAIRDLIGTDHLAPGALDWANRRFLRGWNAAAKRAIDDSGDDTRELR